MMLSKKLNSKIEKLKQKFNKKIFLIIFYLNFFFLCERKYQFSNFSIYIYLYLSKKPEFF
jgi:hypothetical protein